MTDAPLDWRSIRPLNGSRANGFEELCAQLACAELPGGVRFERKGTPDAGVECYAVWGDESEWGWQAKYFDNLGGSQWSQIDKSVRTALEKHPRLTRYFVCIPLDRPDARIGKKSAKDKWDGYVTKWSKQATKLGMNVEFVYWGSHELLQRLARSEHTGRVHFWFDLRGFDPAWFAARLDESLKTAGPRYTPEAHVDLPIALQFEAFGRTDRFFAREKIRARTIREKLRNLGLSQNSGDEVIEAAVGSVVAKVDAVLTSIGEVRVQPTGPLPFAALAEQLRLSEGATEELSRLLADREHALDAKPKSAESNLGRHPGRSNPFRSSRILLYRLTSELRSARQSFLDAARIAGSNLMLLRGAAGTGKTHLLCDVARQRILAGSPTVLLMGQRFVSHEAPWSQALQQMDLATLSAEDFVGALEAAAQASGSRALLMVDAINEGAGRIIWPSHLAAFLAHAERSPWIGVVLSVRSSYETLVMPEDVHSRAAVETHEGFAENEYDAAKTFFVHYGLELPSTPILAPEFQNPLFLKTLCQGLNAKGERRLPRGYHGITSVFDLYLGAINERLASRLGFDARFPLVRRALEAVSTDLVGSGSGWLSLAQAAQIVDALLPGREFERSLYHGLVSEGVLVEEAVPRGAQKAEEVVFLAYERFADHLAAKTLLDTHLDDREPALTFAAGARLAFICDEKKPVSPGLIEALCVQIPERTGKELIAVAPGCSERWGIADAFRQSLIWRAYSAFSKATQDALNDLCRSEIDLHSTIDVLLTLAILPGHPLNAHFLDGRLRRDAMPDRDAWWSAYLHQAWGTRGAVDRLVDWASALGPTTAIDDEAVDLCAIALAWMLTTSNRFLRDRATKALVCLLTGRVGAVARLVDRFSNVDDPYVIERVYAVAYGVAMRSHDPAAVGALANRVYNLVFAGESPPPHILLRDYARGVVERALHLGSAIDVIPGRIRPPYKSAWPTIPSAEDINPFLVDRSEGSSEPRQVQWGRNRIVTSVMSDDFAWYVIGTNSSPYSTDWLSLTFEDPPWAAPPRRRDLLRALVDEFSVDERKAWEAYEAAEDALDAAMRTVDADNYHDTLPSDAPDLGATGETPDEASSPELTALEDACRVAIAALEAVITEEHQQRLQEILSSKEPEREERRPPRFDLRQIQRYVLERVFDLGWTEERFGSFDRYSVESHGREASKAERVGKKYQWIAYHEILAHVSDRFQYRERSREEEGDQAYEGPWQDFLRDIDPSCPLRSLPGGTSWDVHSTAWWGVTKYQAWGDPARPDEWARSCDDLPKVEELLLVDNPSDSSRWLNGHGFFTWRQQAPVDREATDVPRRELWYGCTGYLVRADDAPAFLRWAEGGDFWNRWMPEPSEVTRMFLGEHAWAPASRYFQKPYYGDDGWVQPRHGCPVKVRSLAFEYIREASGFDCSVDESFTLHLPASDLVSGLGTRWSGQHADFVDADGRVVAQDPTAHEKGPSALLLRYEPTRQFLEREGLTICWAILGEKMILGGRYDGPHHASVRMSGAFALVDQAPVGFVKRLLSEGAEPLKVINVVRVGDSTR